MNQVEQPEREYTEVCGQCREAGVASVNRTVPPKPGACAHCGLPMTQAAR